MGTFSLSLALADILFVVILVWAFMNHFLHPATVGFLAGFNMWLYIRELYPKKKDKTNNE